jgi:hypothetical protein
MVCLSLKLCLKSECRLTHKSAAIQVPARNRAGHALRRTLIRRQPLLLPTSPMSSSANSHCRTLSSRSHRCERLLSCTIVRGQTLEHLLNRLICSALLNYQTPCNERLCRPPVAHTRRWTIQKTPHMRDHSSYTAVRAVVARGRFVQWILLLTC